MMSKCVISETSLTYLFDQGILTGGEGSLGCPPCTNCLHQLPLTLIFSFLTKRRRRELISYLIKGKASKPDPNHNWQIKI
jgi:hypothetical protein